MEPLSPLESAMLNRPRFAKPAPSKEARADRLNQRSIKFVPKPRKGTRAKRKRDAIKEAE